MSDSDTQSLNLNRKSENDQILSEEEDAVAKALEAESQEEVQPKEEAPKQEETPAQPVEEPKEETTETPEQPDSQSESENQEHSQLSERGQNRVKDLADQAAKVPELERKLEVLQNIVRRTRSTLPSWMTEETQNKPAPKSGGTNLLWDQSSTPKTPSENEDGTIEVTQEELIAQAEEAGRKAAKEEAIDQKIDEVLQEDAIEAEENYPVFKKSLADGSDNPQYNEELTNLVFGIYKNERQAGNKTVRLKDIVSKVMTMREQAAEEGRKQSAEKLARAAAEQAIDPSGTPASSTNDNVEDKIKGAKSMKDLMAIEKLIPSEK